MFLRTGLRLDIYVRSFCKPDIIGKGPKKHHSLSTEFFLSTLAIFLLIFSAPATMFKYIFVLVQISNDAGGYFFISSGGQTLFFKSEAVFDISKYSGKWLFIFNKKG
jgi:hypothetical protein